MAYQASTDTLLSIEGRLVTGKGTLFSIQERPFSHKHEEVSLVGEEYDYNVQTGKWSYGFGLSGFVKDDNTSLTRLINATEVAKEPLSVILARWGKNPGAHADIFPQMIVSGGDVDLPREGLIKVNNFQYNLAEGTPPLLDATLILHTQLLSDTDAPYEETRYDFGAAHTGPWKLVVHIDNILWQRATSVEVEIHTNSAATPDNDGSGWTQVSADGAHVIDNETGVVRGATFETSTEDLARWVAVNLAWDGGSGPTADVTVALHRG